MCIHVYTPTYGHFIGFKAHLQWLDPAMAPFVAQRRNIAAAERHLVDKGIAATDGPFHLVGVDGVAVSDLGKVWMGRSGDLDDGWNEG